MTLSATLDGVPQEVLEQIAFFSATETFLGPPSILPLLLTNRKIHSWLSIRSNPTLYGRIFTSKFDIGAVVRRLGTERTNPQILADELQRRWHNLKRIRARSDSTVPSAEDDPSPCIRQLLFEAYFMILENEGKNEIQLREYAQMDQWLREYWFHEAGASRAISLLRTESWIPETQEMSLAMWIFWFMLRTGDFKRDDDMSMTVLHVVKIIAIAAHKYDLTGLPWVDFIPQPPPETQTILYYSKPHQIHLLPPATPAILSFLSLANGWVAEGVRHSTPLPPSLPGGDIPRSLEWDCEWERSLNLGRGEFDRILTDAFRPGSIEGVWEGLFTYTEFTAYAQLLGGGSPRNLQRSMVVRHRQTWKLREHHLIVTDSSCSDSGIGLESDTVEPVAGGDPLRSYFPTGTKVTETREGIEVYYPAHRDIIRYQRMSDALNTRGASSVHDVIITGEGHSAWGQFNLVGRVRPCDGFISLLKEYIDGDRGRWLYRGYLVGNMNGNLAGRWRDTLSPADVHGYEGCFAMSRRR